jgi:hypothetical protein
MGQHVMTPQIAMVMVSFSPVAYLGVAVLLIAC